MTGRAAILGAALCLVSLAGAGAADILPHRAVYGLSLKETSGGSTLADVKGAMYVDWVETCEGWSSSQRLEIRFIDLRLPDIDIDSKFASWESRDGLSYRFNVLSLHNGQPEKELRGQASLPALGEVGKAEFTAPEPRALDLPAGTIFPGRHMLELLERAAAGDKIVSRIVFDGTSEDGPFEINAVIGPLKKPAEKLAALPPELDKPYRPMRLAFFNLGREHVEPFYELSAEVMDNGIARSFLLDYGDSIIAAKLGRIELMERPRCGG